MADSRYIGRFTLSSSGEPHFSSLIAALGSYLRVCTNQGIWYVRIEDINPPREAPGATDTILRQLDHYGLHWDGNVLWQSQRHEAYREVPARLGEQGLSYYCTCIRARIYIIGGIYDSYCRNLGLGTENVALHLRQTRPVLQFTNCLRDTSVTNEPLTREDFIIHCRDGLFAYNLTVVVDDHFRGITEIARGTDLIGPTVRQISLYQHFGWQTPDYPHLPLALNAGRNKPSKQNHAPVLPESDSRPEIVRALRFSNQDIAQNRQALSMDDLLNQAAVSWQPAEIEHSQMASAEL